MGLLRSEPMKHGTLVLPYDRARNFIDEIGSNCNMQFEDMNARDMNRPYKKHIQRIDEMERILRFLTEELKKFPEAEVVTDNIDDFLQHSDKYKLDDVEAQLKRYYKDFLNNKDNSATLIAKRDAALEQKYVVKMAMASMAVNSPPAQVLPRLQEGDQFEYAASRSLLDDEEGVQHRTMETMFSNIAGVIPKVEQDRFARSLFRATRGNTFTHFQEIHDAKMADKKAVFVIYFQDQRSTGASQSYMHERVRRICSGFGVNVYAWPSNRKAAEQMRAGLESQVEDEEKLLKAHEAFVRESAATLVEVRQGTSNSLIEEWRMFCKKEKSIYATLNMFEGQMNLRANCWYPAYEEDQIRALLIQYSADSRGASTSSAMLVSDRIPPRKTPPTYFRRNQFTACAQDLVDLYGLPSYQEANPMLFTLVTFPFLFGVMYGDVGHGTLLFLIGCYLCYNSEAVRAISPPLWSARYMIAMMGFFGIYAGFLYNDCFSIGLNFFGSRWHPGPHGDGKMNEWQPGYDITNSGSPGPYPFGLDPAWHSATNELVYLNSMKMKISVILGVAHMIVGLLLRFANCIHDKNAVDLFCECVPMMTFMICFFGFMDYMIMFKWVTPIPNPPSVVTSLIAMGMWQHDPNPMFGPSLPQTLMTITMLSIPCMLFPKPIIIYFKQMQQARASQTRGPEHSLVGQGLGHDDEGSLIPKTEDDDEHHSMGDVWIHQIIETIEYVLGTVSHTASYLRLWALSLAHQQLSVVFFQKTILMGMGMPVPLNIIAIFILFQVWFAITLGVLMGMDVMECFLHVLRLHWVEFQTKFYKAQGYGFRPFNHKATLEEEEQ